ncbi:uncharacterized protein MEPE_04913 [Melanopsichium pennsylvanicum]|uniref:Uncharacterized protein n=2 Tax=Melanopsichium pennsylvanicum TaxID=63383 RepID=A0AAJ5C773_9BASI|nr:uncharacterized protein BN887_04786 [Melanopsichium pennsylvanicum 4]SNX86204.1 uncharacterized protein MEPE_04913 [Melanopsichium pennsylvanicum]
MLHHLPPSMHNDPFHFSSSSPERLATRYVATRPNPYTVKSQNTQHYTSLRSTAQLIPLDPRLSSASMTTSASSSTRFQQSSVDILYSSLEAASRSPRCSSKPAHTSPAKQYPLVTMVKPKPRPIKALALSAELAAAKRSSCVKLASAAAGKRRRNVVQVAKQHTKENNNATADLLASQARARSRQPTLSTSLSPSLPRRLTSSKAFLDIPRITIRSPTPEPEPALEHLFQGKSSNKAKPKGSHVPLYSDALLKGLDADLSNAEDGIDVILSKFFDLRKHARPVCIELLRYLAFSVSKLYSFVEELESELGQAKLRAISSRLFRHTITGFFHLLDDPLAPYGAASGLALVSLKVLQDFDKAAEWCCRAMAGPSTDCAKVTLKHDELFLNVLKDELDNILQRGLAMTDMHNKLALPGKEVPLFEDFSNDTARPGDEGPYRPGGIAWAERAKMRKQWAQDGDERDRFVGIDVVRFIGQLALHDVVGVDVLEKWLDRFLNQTVCLEIPSVWEIECACALLITVGPILDRKTERADTNLALTDALQTSAEESGGDRLVSQDYAKDKSRESAGKQLLQRAMDRVDFLVTKADISQSAREWFIEVQQLRERGWSREEDQDECLSSE